MRAVKKGERDWWCEWRNHEANLWLEEDGTWSGDMVAYGEWDSLDESAAKVVAYAFGLPQPTRRPKLDAAERELYEYWFGWRREFACAAAELV